MMEARISEVLVGIQKISLICIPPEAVPPNVLLEMNIKHRQHAGKLYCIALIFHSSLILRFLY